MIISHKLSQRVWYYTSQRFLFFFFFFRFYFSIRPISSILEVPLRPVSRFALSLALRWLHLSSNSRAEDSWTVTHTLGVVCDDAESVVLGQGTG